jgi:hypothetical protein
MNPLNPFQPNEDFPLAAAPTCEVPPEVEARLRGRLAEFRGRVTQWRRVGLLGRLLPPAHPVRWAAALGLAALVTIVVMSWPSTRSDAWADVVKQVESVPWIHGQGKSNGRPVEFWISLPQRIWALRWGNADFVGFSSSAAKTKQQYNAFNGTLVQLPMEADDEEEFHQADALFARAFRGEPQADLSTSRQKLVKQQNSEVEVDGRKWLDFELTFRLGDTDHLRVVTYRVDPVTRLPKYCLEKPRFADDAEDRIDFDYPQSGPADIYALGVPRDAKIADRIPSPELAEILAGLQAGREKMDAYSGLIVQGGRGAHWSQAFLVWRVWRSGNRWRIEQAGPNLPGRWKAGEPRPPLPPDDADQLAWWKAAAEKIKFYPVLVSDGKTSYRFTVKTDPERPQNADEWERVRFIVESVEPDYMPTPTLAGPSAGLLPEQVARPPLGIPSEGREASVEMHPANGPKGPILLSVSEKRVGSPQQREWIDPARGYMAMRQEMAFTVNSQGKPQIQLQEIAEAAQSPSGAWYPRVMRGGAPVEEWGEEIDEGKWGTTTRYYLDFTTPIPREVFATPELKQKTKPRAVAAQPRTQRQWNQRSRSMTHLRTIATAMNAYVEEHGHFPAASIVGPDGKTPHSWRVELLPYLDHKKLFDQYNLSEPWDNPGNQKVLAQMPAVYSAEQKPSDTDTAVFVLAGEATLFPPDKTLRTQDIVDSAAHTLLAVEAKRNIPWTKPEDIAYDPAQPLPELGGFDPDGFGVVFADTSSMFIERKLFDDATIRAWITPAGKENVQRPD